MSKTLHEQADSVHAPVKLSIGSAQHNRITGETTPEQIIEQIRAGEWAREVAAIRAETDPTKRGQLKKRLPAVMWGGTFSKRSNDALLVPSGFIGADLDHLGERLNSLHDDARRDPHCLACFVSPSGDGLKLAFQASSFRQVQQHVRARYGVECDHACRDIARLCFVSHDPAAFHNPDALPLPENSSAPMEHGQANTAGAVDTVSADMRAQIEVRTGPVRWKSETRGFCDCPGQKLHTRPNGERDCKIERRGEDGSWYAYCVHHSCAAAIAELNRKLERVGPLANAVVLFGGSVRITDTATDLFKRIAPSRKMFTRGRVPVVLRTEDGKQVLSPLKPTQAQSELEAYADFAAWKSVKADKDEGGGTKSVLKPTTLSATHAAAILDCYAATSLLPTINGLLNCPILIERNGALEVCGEGYNEATGLLILQGGTPPEVPLGEARESLLALLAEFDFQTPGDKSRAVASFITPALKMGGLLRGNVPADVAEADQSQSGKTYRQRMVAATYREQSAIVPLKRGGVGGVDESFFEKLVQGRPFIQFDNFRGALDSPAVEAFLTAEGSFGCRVPGVREIAVDPSRFFVQLTSNGVETSRDLANRSSIVRIRKREGVQFKDVLRDIRERQPYFLGCVFAVVRDWHRQGKPRTQEAQHDFREWCQVLDWVVQNIFGLAPLMDGHREAQTRVSNPTLGLLRALCLEVARAGELGKPLTASQLCDMGEAAGLKMPGGDPNTAHRVLGSKLAPLFKDGHSVSVEGFTVQRNSEQRPREDGNGNYDVKLYIVGRDGPETEVVSERKETTHGAVTTPTTPTTVTPSAVSKNVSTSSGNVSGGAATPYCGYCGTVDAPPAKVAPPPAAVASLPRFSVADFSNDPLIAAALQEFQGRLVEVKGGCVYAN